MWKGNDGAMNTVSMVFLALTLATCLCTVLIVGDVVGPPSFIAPVTEVPQPTLRLIPTLGEPTATNTPTPGPTARPTLTPLANTGG